MTTVLVVGATGGIGHLVVEEAIRQGFTTRALVRNPEKAAKLLPDQAQIVVGDVTHPETLPAAVDGVDAVIFTVGANSGGGTAETVDYEGVRNVLEALRGHRVRIVLMTAIGITNRSAYGELGDWKRRSERLVRASGLPYTIVRPGWFDFNGPGEDQLLGLQGDTRRTGTPADGGVSRRQIAQVLVHSLESEGAEEKTFELIGGAGPATADFEAFFAPLEPDAEGSLDGIHDEDNMPVDQEPPMVRKDLAAVSGA